MSITLSCGHREDDFDNHHNVMTREWEITEEGWVKAVGYSVVCLSCFEAYKSEGLLLESEEEAMQWLRSTDGTMD